MARRSSSSSREEMDLENELCLNKLNNIKRHAKKMRLPSSTSNSSEDEEDTETTASTADVKVNVRFSESTTRQSKRLKNKQQRPGFRLPSRSTVWDDIDTKCSPTKLRMIKPKRTENNFLKVHNTYNFDDYEDTSDDESEGFVTDSSEEEKSADMPKKRVQNFHRRIKAASSSSDEEVTERYVTEGQDQDCAVKKIGKEKVSEESPDENGDSLPPDFIQKEDCNNTSSEDEILSSGKRMRNRSLLVDSDNENDSEKGSACNNDAIDTRTNEPEEEERKETGSNSSTQGTKKKKNRNSSTQDTFSEKRSACNDNVCDIHINENEEDTGSNSSSEDSSSSKGSACNDNICDAHSSENEGEKEETGLNSSNEDSCSGSDAGSNGAEECSRSLRLKKRKLQVFENFKGAMAKKRLEEKS